MESYFDQVISLMSSAGLYNVGLALLLVWLLTFGLLESSKIIRSKKINTIISLIIAFFSIYYPPSANIIFYIVSRGSLFVVGGFILVLIIYMFSKAKLHGISEAEERDALKNIMKNIKIFMILLAIAIGLYLIYAAGVAQMMGLTNILPMLIASLPALVIIGGVIYVIYKIVWGPINERKKEMKEHYDKIQEIYRRQYEDMYNHYIKQGYPKNIAEAKAKKDAEKLIDKIY